MILYLHKHFLPSITDCVEFGGSASEENSKISIAEKRIEENPLTVASFVVQKRDLLISFQVRLENVSVNPLTTVNNMTIESHSEFLFFFVDTIKSVTCGCRTADVLHVRTRHAANKSLPLLVYSPNPRNGELSGAPLLCARVSKRSYIV